MNRRGFFSVLLGCLTVFGIKRSTDLRTKRLRPGKLINFDGTESWVDTTDYHRFCSDRTSCWDINKEIERGAAMFAESVKRYVR